MKKIIIFFFLPFLLLIVIVMGVASGGSNSTNDIPDDDIVDGDYEDYEPTGDSEIGNAIVKSALSKIGCPYVWGAEGPDEFDCSGLVYWACKENNVNFVRTTAKELAKMGVSVEQEELQAGDIITFKTDPTYISHVGIYIGDGKMVHAPNKNSTVRVDNVFSSQYWMKVFYNCRRIY